MPCFKPLTAYRSAQVSEKGKRPLVFNRKDSLTGVSLQIACGQCIGCRLRRSSVWATRCVHEAQLHDDNCFITLTYSDEHLPEGLSLCYEDFQLFMKRFKSAVRRKSGAAAARAIRFYMCGEYGEQFGRPHFHACIFGYDFADKTLWQIRNDNRLYRSEFLESLWTFGYSSIGSVTFESAAYVARYIVKKRLGDDAAEHYRYIVPETGEIYDRRPEFTNMSRNGGIGKKWFEKFSSDVYPDDFVVINGRKLPPPRYYDGLYELLDPIKFDSIKRRRVLNAKKYLDNNTHERLIVREKVQLARLQKLPRVLE